MIQEGDVFPQFSLEDQDGNVVTLADLKGAKAVIYFYPKDDTTGCTAEACAFNESLPDFGDVRVLGVSPDPVKSHKKFADKYSLRFTLLSDPEKTLCEAVGVWVKKSMYGNEYMGVERSTFLVDESGKIMKLWRKVKVPNHEAEVKVALTL